MPNAAYRNDWSPGRKGQKINGDFQDISLQIIGPKIQMSGKPHNSGSSN
jgi:hypothetical protein